MEYNLFGKTEVWIEGISLKRADLRKISATTAKVLGLPQEEVMVVDVRDNLLTLDILRKHISAESIVGKGKELLEALRDVRGVSLSPDASIHSDGILGMIALEKDKVAEIIKQSKKMIKQIQKKVEKRVMVFSSGSEVQNGAIKDLNAPYLVKRFKNMGYDATEGNPLPDNRYLIAAHISDAINHGFGLIVTTGGVGAEDKDQTIEGIFRLDSTAATSYIVHYRKGEGRHIKDGVRICVGKYGGTLIIALPGPHNEVRTAAAELFKILEEGIKDKEVIAERIASSLRKCLMEKMSYHLEEKGEENA